MKPAELGEEIAVDLEALEATGNELLALRRDVAGKEPTVREKTAAAAFLAQFYNGIENILKRISRCQIESFSAPLGTARRERLHRGNGKRLSVPTSAGQAQTGQAARQEN